MMPVIKGKLEGKTRHLVEISLNDKVTAIVDPLVNDCNPTSEKVEVKVRITSVEIDEERDNHVILNCIALDYVNNL